MAFGHIDMELSCERAGDARLLGAYKRRDDVASYLSIDSSRSPDSDVIAGKVRDAVWDARNGARRNLGDEVPRG